MAESKGEEFMKKAEQKLKSFSFFGAGTKFDDAVELFNSAAAQFKIGKCWEKAGNAYLAAAEVCQVKLKDDSQATEYYTNAAQCFRKENPEEATRVYSLAAQMHMEQNHFSTAAKIYKAIGEMCEEDRNFKGALDAFSQSADCYLAEDTKVSGSQMLLKVAHYSAILEDYKRAVELYEQVAEQALQQQLTSWGAKEHYFKAMLCKMALLANNKDLGSTMEELDRTFEKYKNSYPAFEDSREAKFIESMLDAMRESDVNKMQDAIIDYDSISKLDDWKSGLIIMVKRAMRESANDVDLT